MPDRADDGTPVGPCVRVGLGLPHVPHKFYGPGAYPTLVLCQGLQAGRSETREDAQAKRPGGTP